jgi:hypothetical protein
VFEDSRARWAYVLTKLGVFAAAAIATWPLTRVFGPRAWWGLGVFGAVLLVITVGVLAAGRASTAAADEGQPEESDPDLDALAEVVLPVEDNLDLHPFAPRDIPDVVADYLEAAHERGFREVRLIHGRGIGVQRERVRSVLSKHRLVEQFHDAPPPRGGWGATIAYLKENGKGEMGNDPPPR